MEKGRIVKRELLKVDFLLTPGSECLYGIYEGSYHVHKGTYNRFIVFRSNEDWTEDRIELFSHLEAIEL